MTTEGAVEDFSAMGSTRRSGPLDGAPDLMKRITASIASVFHGPPIAIELALIGLATEGHILIEDLPGVGKTTLAKAIARATGLKWQRIQGTADLLPSDVIGSVVPVGADPTSAKPQGASIGSFAKLAFKRGPVFSNVVLFDELNRASPRAQSALLEAMEERHVTVDGSSQELPRPFFVLATQNPADVDGTFLLPQNQLDRFLIRITLGYPTRQNESKILGSEHNSSTEASHGAVDLLKPVTDVEGVKALINSVSDVFVADGLTEYLLDLIWATRSHPDVMVGASPRAGLAVQKSAKAMALIRSRDYITPDDIKSVFLPVLGHRIKLNSSSIYAGVTPESVLISVLNQVPVPIRRKD